MTLIKIKKGTPTLSARPPLGTLCAIDRLLERVSFFFAYNLIHLKV